MDNATAIKERNEHVFDFGFAHSYFFCKVVSLDCAIFLLWNFISVFFNISIRPRRSRQTFIMLPFC